MRVSALNSSFVQMVTTPFLLPPMEPTLQLPARAAHAWYRALYAEYRGAFMEVSRRATAFVSSVAGAPISVERYQT